MSHASRRKLLSFCVAAIAAGAMVYVGCTLDTEAAFDTITAAINAGSVSSRRKRSRTQSPKPTDTKPFLEPYGGKDEGPDVGILPANYQQLPRWAQLAADNGLLTTNGMNTGTFIADELTDPNTEPGPSLPPIFLRIREESGDKYYRVMYVAEGTDALDTMVRIFHAHALTKNGTDMTAAAANMILHKDAKGLFVLVMRVAEEATPRWAQEDDPRFIRAISDALNEAITSVSLTAEDVIADGLTRAEEAAEQTREQYP